MAFGEVLFYLLIIGIFLFIISKILFGKSRADIDYEEKMKLRLNDDWIYDPETGTKMTLEQEDLFIKTTNDPTVSEFEKIFNTIETQA